MPNQRMIVNGIDLSNYSMWVDTPSGWADAPGRQDRTVDVQGAGELLIVGAERIQPRRWQVSGTMIAPTVDDAVDLWDAVKMLMTDVWLEVMILPWDDRFCSCRLQTMTRDEGTLYQSGFRFTMTFLAPSPYLEAAVVDQYGLAAGGEVIFALGTAPSHFRVELIGPATSPTLTYYDANGLPRGTIKIAGNVAANEWLSFDSHTLELVRHPAIGSPVGGANLFGNASRLFQLSPFDSVAGRGPSMSLDSGQALVYVRRAFQ